MKFLSRLLPLVILFVAAGCGKSTGYWKEQMKSADSSKRLHAVHAFQERTKDKQAVPLLIGALDDEDTFIRRDAARALGKFGQNAREAVPALVVHLKDSEPSVRKASAQALKEIDPTAVTSR